MRKLTALALTGTQSLSLTESAERVRTQRAPRETSRSSLRCAGFTLIELLTVIVIIAILAGLIVGASKYALTKGARSRAQAEIAAMETAMESFKTDNGFYPNTGTTRANVNSNSSVLYTALAGGPKQYFHFKAEQLQVLPGAVTNIMDPFGRPYNYYQTNDSALVTNVVTFDLWSYGPNGINDEGTSDDLTNWRQQ
jgi:general secretion pathway protein G